MFRAGSIQSHLTLRDKIFSLDLTLTICIFLIGIILAIYYELKSEYESLCNARKTICG